MFQTRLWEIFQGRHVKRTQGDLDFNMVSQRVHMLILMKNHEKLKRLKILYPPIRNKYFGTFDEYVPTIPSGNTTVTRCR